jgi:hypothetical protein
MTCKRYTYYCHTGIQTTCEENDYHEHECKVSATLFNGRNHKLLTNLSIADRLERLVD